MKLEEALKLSPKDEGDQWEPYYDSGLPDSGEREEYETGSRRDTREGKGRFDLLPIEPIRRWAIRLEQGAKKYGERNWEKGQPLSRYLDSAFRHLGQLLEHDDAEDHAAAVLFNVGAFIWTQKEINAGRLPKSLDDYGGEGC